MFGSHHNQINLLATRGKDDLFGRIAFQHDLRDATSASDIFGNRLAQMLAGSVAVRSGALDDLDHPKLGPERRSYAGCEFGTFARRVSEVHRTQHAVQLALS
jgi:hypothetical protein